VHLCLVQQERARTLRELAAVQLALAHQAVVAALGGEGAEEGAEQRPKRRRRMKNRDVLDGTTSAGALGEHGYASMAEAADEPGGHHIGGPRTNLHQRKRPAAGEVDGDDSWQRPSKLPRERLMTSQEANQNNRKLPPGFTYVPISAVTADGRPQQGWGHYEDGSIQDTNGGLLERKL
jgi:hypothetical protein